MMLVMSLAPAGVAALATSRGSAVPAALAFGPAAAMAVLWWAGYPGAKVLSPLQRRRTLLLEWRGGLYGVFLAVLATRLLPGDGWLARWLAANSWWMAALCVAVPIVVTAASTDTVLLRLLPLGFLRVLVDRGTVAFFLATLTASHDLAEFAAWIVGYNAALELVELRPGGNWTPRRLDAQRFLDAAPLMRQRIIDAWLAEAVLRPVRRGRAPDVAFVYSLCAEVAPAIMAHRDPGVAAIHITPPRLVNDAMAWHDRALNLVKLAEDQIRDPNEQQRRQLSLARARCAHARADIYMTQGLVDEALEAIREATTRWHECGLHNLCADITATIAVGTVPSPLLTTPTPPDEILARLGPLVNEPALTPRMRRWTLLGAAICHMMLRQHESAVALHEEARALASAPAKRRRLNAERRAAGMIMLSASTVRRWDATMTIAWYAATGIVRFAQTNAESAEALPLTPLGTWTHNGTLPMIRTAGQLWASGNHDAAATMLEKAADALERDRLPAMAIQVLSQLGIAQRAVDPPHAYRNLRRALEIRETLRGSVLSADLRMRFGGGSEDLYIELVQLLHEAEFFPSASWPQWPAREAFELVERARARSMLELLGEALGPPAQGPYAALAETERELLAELFSAEEARDTTRIRSVRDELDGIWRQMAAIGTVGAEYAQLRRGEPAAYYDIRRMLGADATGSGHSRAATTATPSGPAHV
ncbi:hypothetical protein [Streptomyces sp. NPDC005209]|uniref:hypothetical protein n=1 Tax=Streptomyces sp. NPDC005209 TaxID=3156715 RepID=UPI0033B8CA52